MLPSSNDYKVKVYAKERMFKSKVAITMEAFRETPPQEAMEFILNLEGKVLGSNEANPHELSYASATDVLTPTGSWQVTTQQGLYNAVMEDDNSELGTSSSQAGKSPQMLFSYNVIETLKRELSKSVWEGKETLKEEIEFAEEIIKQVKARWRGRSSNPEPTFFMPFRYIRDWINGSDANTTNYWNQINVLSNGTNLTTGLPVSTNGSLTNAVNITDGDPTTYGYAWGGAPVWVSIDLGSIRSDIDMIQVFHYYLDGRTFYDSKTEISEDGITWYPIRDSAIQGTYAESSNGKTTFPKDVSKPRATISLWDSFLGQYKGSSYHESSTNEILELPESEDIRLDSNGFMHFVAYGSSKADENSPDTSVFSNYAELQLDVVIDNHKVFYDDTVISFNLLEEVFVLNESVPSNELVLTMDNSNGDFDVLNFKNMFQILSTKPRIDVELGLVLESGEIEWKPMGSYFLTEWRVDATSKVVTLIGNDYFALLSDTIFNQSVQTILYWAAEDVLTTGGVPKEDQIIDLSLLDITVNVFPESLDCRTALQHIGIASRCVVYQDREGRINIKPFDTLDIAGNYLNYPSTQSVMFGYPSSNTYALNNTEGGMRNLRFEVMYDAPDISLEKSIWQLIIKVYPIGENGEELEAIESIYTNPDLITNNGVSFTLDNPLIQTEEHADLVAEWYFRESNYNVYYVTQWRQNPILECADLILIEDSFRADKQARIVKQVYDYQGYLSGSSESRGGI